MQSHSAWASPNKSTLPWELLAPHCTCAVLPCSPTAHLYCTVFRWVRKLLLHCSRSISQTTRVRKRKTAVWRFLLQWNCNDFLISQKLLLKFPNIKTATGHYHIGTSGVYYLTSPAVFMQNVSTNSWGAQWRRCPFGWWIILCPAWWCRCHLSAPWCLVWSWSHVIVCSVFHTRFLLVLWFPPSSQKKASSWIGYVQLLTSCGCGVKTCIKADLCPGTQEVEWISFPWLFEQLSHYPNFSPRTKWALISFI